MITSHNANENEKGNDYITKGNTKCNKECDTMVLGYLTRMLMKVGVMTLNDKSTTTVPNNDYEGFSMNGLIKHIRSSELPSLHSLEEAPRSYYGPHGSCYSTNRDLPTCAIKQKLRSSIDDIVDRERGLSLSSQPGSWCVNRIAHHHSHHQEPSW